MRSDFSVNNAECAKITTARTDTSLKLEITISSFQQTVGREIADNSIFRGTDDLECYNS